MRRLFLIAAVLFSSVDAVNRVVTQAEHVVQADQVLQSWSVIVSDLWADLVIGEAGAVSPANFDKSDKAVKDKFVTDCVLVFDVHDASRDDVGGVVKDMCAKAGGKAPECVDMEKTLWKAHEDDKLKPWCEKTFGWFADKTRPKCLVKCKALLCKDRCSENDQVKDLSDEIAAYQIKLDTATTKEKRFEKVAEEQKKALANIEKLDKEQCTPAKDAVKKLEASQASIGKELGVLSKASSDAQDDTDKAFEKLKGLRADKKAKKADASKAKADFDKASEALQQAKKKQAAQNKSAIKAKGDVTEALAKQKLQCESVKSYQGEYDDDKKTNDGDLKAVGAEKTKLQEAMDKVIAKKTKLETPLKAALK